MARAYMYINNNPFVIFLPCERGGQVMFNPGQSTTKQWFSRFVGFRQLSRVLIAEGVPSTPAGAGTPAAIAASAGAGTPAALRPSAAIAAPAVPPPPAARKNVSSYKDEETNDYVLKNGIYTCKHCDIFRTGSSLSMRMHLADYHHLEAGVNQPTPNVPPPAHAGPTLGQGEKEGEKILGTSKAMTQGAPSEDETVTTTKPTVPAQGESETRAPEAPASGPGGGESATPATPPAVPSGPVFKCEAPGCGKAFSSPRGLVMHKTRIHSA